MTTKWEQYRTGQTPLAESHLTWPYYGAGLQNLGKGGQPVVEPMPICGSDEILVRIDAFGIGAPDLMMVRAGNEHPLFFKRDFTKNPTRLGCEVAMTVIQVGEAWCKNYRPGQRLGIQPDVLVNGKRCTFGINLLGGMAQYITLGPTMLAGSTPSVFPVPTSFSYTDIALLEPWARVDVAYRPSRRLEPKPGGVMWIRGQPGDEENRYRMTRHLDSKVVVLSDVPASLAHWVQSQNVECYVRNKAPGSTLVNAYTDGFGFDDIVLLGPSRVSAVLEAQECLSLQGLLNIVSKRSIGETVPIDISHFHYDHPAYVGYQGRDIAFAYGAERNRSELRTDGVLWIVGGGSFGRIHLQRALEMAHGPRAIIVTDQEASRLEGLYQSYIPLVQAVQRELIVVNPAEEPGRLSAEVERLTGGRGCDDIVVVAPDVEATQAAVHHLAPDGMIVLCSEMSEGNTFEFPIDNIYKHHAQITGSTGSALVDQLRVLDKIKDGTHSPSHSVAAIGGMNALVDGMQAALSGEYPGRIVIFPHLVDLPLIAPIKLKTYMPSVYSHLGVGETWNIAAEQALFEAMFG